ncbi:MAG: hypothetical protein ACRCVN_02620 [Spirochaetia bacterium]
MIQLILGTMFAGKSTELLKYLRRGCIAKKKVCLLTPAFDSRGFFTHNDEKLYQGIDFFDLSQDTTQVKTTLNYAEQYDIIGIDEYQFLPIDHWQGYIFPFLKNIQNKKKDCYIAGLSGTFLLTPFNIVSLTIPLANQIQLENAICKECGDIAYYTHSINDQNSNTDIVIENIGAAEKYMPLCWQCWHSMVKEKDQIC